MGLVLHTQRRAVEVFAHKKLAKQPWPADAVFEEKSYFSLTPMHGAAVGTHLTFLGVSRGVGTCSDIHAVNVAVFGERHRDETHQESFSRLASCQYAVLLWPGSAILLKPLEVFGSGRVVRVDPIEVDPFACLETVELLDPAEFKHFPAYEKLNGKMSPPFTSVDLARTGWLSSYVPI